MNGDTRKPSAARRPATARDYVSLALVRSTHETAAACLVPGVLTGSGDGRGGLAQEECIRAREAELEHISAQAEFGTQDGRAKRTRKVVTEQVRRTSRMTVEETGRQDVAPTPDPRERLSQDELATVNQHAQRIAAKVDGGPSRAAIGRLLGDRIAGGQSTTKAVFDTLEQVKLMPSTLLEVADVPEVPGESVNVSGEIVELWNPSSPAIAQVGLIADNSGKIKFTSWAKSDQKWVKEGDQIQLWIAKKNWYQGPLQSRVDLR